MQWNGECSFMPVHMKLPVCVYNQERISGKEHTCYVLVIVLTKILIEGVDKAFLELTVYGSLHLDRTHSSHNMSHTGHIVCNLL